VFVIVRHRFLVGSSGGTGAIADFPVDGALRRRGA
jgi:hypothetical protein